MKTEESITDNTLANCMLQRIQRIIHHMKGDLSLGCKDGSTRTEATQYIILIE